MYKPTEIKNQFSIKALCTAFHKHRKSDYYFKGERHKMWELVIVSKGKIGVTSDNDVFTLNAGQAILHKPWEFHRLWSEKIASSIIIISFLADNMPQYSRNIFDIPDMNIPTEIINKIHASFYISDNIFVGEPLPDKEIEAQLSIKELELFLLNTINNKSEALYIEKSYSAEIYTSIINILNENIHRNLTIDEIAAMCNMSRSNLTKTFSKYSGMGVISYFNQLKIDKSVPMLKSGIPISEIAENLGFANQNYFCTVFKKFKGKSPSYYK